MRLGGLVAELIHHQKDEIAEHQIDDGPGAGHRGAHGQSHEAGFGNGRVDDTFGTEFLDEAREHLEGRAGLGHILAHQENRRVAAHFLGDGLVHGL